MFCKAVAWTRNSFRYAETASGQILHTHIKICLFLAPIWEMKIWYVFPIEWDNTVAVEVEVATKGG